MSIYEEVYLQPLQESISGKGRWKLVQEGRWNEINNKQGEYVGEQCSVCRIVVRTRLPYNDYCPACGSFMLSGGGWGEK